MMWTCPLFLFLHFFLFHFPLFSFFSFSVYIFYNTCYAIIYESILNAYIDVALHSVFAEPGYILMYNL